MADPFISEIRIVGFNFPPKGWAFCSGQVLSIEQNTALFALLGTTYGGDGVRTFALPNLQGRVPLHMGIGHGLGATGGSEFHTLTLAEADHQHTLLATANQATTSSPAGGALATKRRGGVNAYQPSANTTLDPSSISTVPADGQPHENRQPSLVMNFVIALVGSFPSQD